jgi:hypothetical protein
MKGYKIMSNAISNDVQVLVSKELNSANEKFPQFNSAHEGYAVILEEVEEAIFECGEMNIELHKLWERVKNNDGIENKKIRAKMLKEKCCKCAEEAIQSAAMCQKFIDMLERVNVNDTV